jgi:hypothetical protein
MRNKTTPCLGNKNLLSFPKHDSLKLILSTISVTILTRKTGNSCMFNVFQKPRIVCLLENIHLEVVS